ncbi:MULTISPECIES: formate dehydrogenase accessory protein FdhE [unclassified Gilliamella]|uniref:formate dehydrogenase accessory protein FdhE n=1 Tax=unclassified Gilliamella TaxID=2685620 RepID=UPI000A346E3B|nr:MULTISPECIES: formate dehydrogenase accessory protein FdhE [unclassified Gilliamella]OTQ74214.1 formate dehydrogenase accessory protein FdhE [Gilliamella sp. N-G2]OTQ80227.1 formate dehydrogenase accessory protein FdhE [Gilliamella sp. N-W3]
MSIKIISQEQLEQQNTSSVIRQIPLLFYPSTKTLYIHRAARLKTLAENNPLSDYLLFCTKIAEQQAKLINQQNAIEAPNLLNNGLAPLSLENLPLNDIWQDYLSELLNSFSDISEQIEAVIQRLKQNNPEQLQEKAISLLQGKFDLVEGNESIFIWSALSVYYSQLANQIKGKAVAKNTDQSWLCPVCNSLPVASVIQLGGNNGLRYLHCSLCESEWYVPRVKCTCCDNMQNIQYFSLDNEMAAIKTECCDACHSYLKILDQDKDPHIEVIADDVASLILDIKTEEEGFAKSGINPFVFAQK